MGHLTSSWVGTGENADVSEEQLQQGLGQDKIQELIKSTGLSEQDLLAKLKEHLPKIIDKLTPEGKLPGKVSAINSPTSPCVLPAPLRNPRFA